MDLAQCHLDSYPESIALLSPQVSVYLLSEALDLDAAALSETCDPSTGPHFPLQPAGGRQVPQEHVAVAVHFSLAHRHRQVPPDVPLREICWRHEPLTRPPHDRWNTPSRLTCALERAAQRAPGPRVVLIPNLQTPKHLTGVDMRGGGWGGAMDGKSTWRQVQGVTEDSGMVVPSNFWGGH